MDAVHGSDKTLSDYVRHAGLLPTAACSPVQ